MANIFGTPQQMVPAQPQYQQNLAQIQQLMSGLNPNQSPQEMLQVLAQKSPQFNNLSSLLNLANGDIRSLVTNMANQQGVDLNLLYQQYKNLYK